jgi:hypothetical protein
MEGTGAMRQNKLAYPALIMRCANVGDVDSAGKVGE